MIDNVKNLTDLIFKIGSLSGIVALFYTIVNASKRRPRLKFDFSGMSGKGVRKDDVIGEYYIFEFNGTIKNQSLETNSILKIYLIVWADNKKRNSALRLGFGGEVSDLDTGVTIPLPLELAPKVGRKLKIVFEIPVKGTTDDQLLKEFMPVGESGSLYLPKHNYELCFEDTDDNFFDQQGRLRSLGEINLRWTLPNTIKELQKGIFLPFLIHMLSIQRSKIFFLFKRIKYRIGL